ncbi:cysteine proteinase [Acephala macrosclerotiorum]|nr:cysteine proteinase [Acephala macrosclerotiorum]
MKVAEILKETLKLHVSNVELASKIYKVTGVPHDELNTPWSPRKRIEAQQKLSQEFDSLFENPTSSRVASNVDCQRVAQSDLAVQEWFAEEVQPALKVRLVGKKRDSLEIKEEYSKSDSRYYAQTAALPLKYSHYRPIKSDTSNGWRAVGFAYFEALLNFRKTSPLEEEIRRITSMNDLLRNFGGFATWMFGDMVEVTTNLLKALAEKLQSSFRDAKHLLRQRFNEPRISKSITQHLRLLASSFMRVNPDLYQVALPDGLGIDRYAKDFIESPSQEIDHLGMALLVEVLLKPIQFDLQIKYVNGGKDRALASKGPPKTFQEDSFSGCSKNVGLQTIYLLYRPGHYDILYKAPVKSSPVNSSPVQYKRDPNKRVRHRGEKAVAPQQVSHHLDSPPTIERPILQFSQHNIAHYKHPDFQPEQWTPEPQTALTWR